MRSRKNRAPAHEPSADKGEVVRSDLADTCALPKWLRLAALVVTLCVAFSVGVVARGDAELTDTPNLRLTPGAVVTVEAKKVCRSGYARDARPKGKQWRRLREAACARYGVRRGERSRTDSSGRLHNLYTIDHLIPLELGGSPSDLRNLWPQPVEAAKRKDRVENTLHELVCSGQLSLEAAQRAIARDWKRAAH